MVKNSAFRGYLEIATTFSSVTGIPVLHTRLKSKSSDTNKLFQNFNM